MLCLGWHFYYSFIGCVTFSNVTLGDINKPIDSLIMADVTSKWPENVPGKFYVDEQCIDCDLCRETAPDFFDRCDDGYSFVKKQPKTDAEVELCVEALEGCPVEAIGDDNE